MKHYKHIIVKHIAGAIGADIENVDISKPLSDDELSEIRTAFLDHLVICIRGQTLQPKSQLACARHFGTPMIYPFVKGLDQYPEITPVIKEKEHKINFGGLWHSWQQQIIMIEKRLPKVVLFPHQRQVALMPRLNQALENI